MSNLPSDPQEAPSKREDSGHPQQLSEHPPTERRSILTLSSESHSGMLPHPAILEAYEKIRKGITDDFVDMAKSILAHDHDVEKAQIEAQKRAIDGTILNTERDQPPPQRRGRHVQLVRRRVQQPDQLLFGEVRPTTESP